MDIRTLQREKPQLYMLLDVSFTLLLRKEFFVPLLKELCEWLWIYHRKATNKSTNIDEATYDEYFIVGKRGNKILNSMMMKHINDTLGSFTFRKQIRALWSNTVYKFICEMRDHDRKL